MSSRTTDIEPDDEFVEEADEEPTDFDAEDDAELADESDDDSDWDEDEDAEDGDGDGDGEDGEEAEALDELEAEELEMLTDDEASETLIVNEEQELRAIRRAELSLDEEGSGRMDGEFQCQSCFLVLNMSQLADKRRKFCRDCAG